MPGPIRNVIMMGVAGSGKSSVGAALAARLGSVFCEGDDLHPAANVAKMTRGDPLDDTDRAPWLAAIAAWMAGQTRTGTSAVVSCSALKRSYRDRLRDADARLVFVMLDVPRDELSIRLAHRPGHFMPPSLLDSQLATLERPAPDEAALILPNDVSVAQSVDRIVTWLGTLGSVA